MEDCYIKLEDLIKKVENFSSLDNVCFVSYDSLDNCIEPNVCVEKLLSKNLETVNPHSLNPNYLKKTEAEEKLNQ